MRSFAQVAALLVVVTASSSADAGPLAYSDNFEAPTINAFWTPTTISGSITLVSSPVHGGSQSVQFNSINTASNKYLYLSHSFASPVYGTLSVWVFDTGADQFSSNALALYTQNSNSPGLQYSIGTFDYDLGPSNGGNYYVTPGAININSGLDRTRAWHQFTLETTPGYSKFFIDGNLVHTDPTGFAFDYFHLAMIAPSWRPAWSGQFDDFSFQPYDVSTPEPASAAVLAGLVILVTAKARRKSATKFCATELGHSDRAGA